MSDRSLRRRSRRVIGDRLGLVQITCTAVLWGTGGIIVQLLHDHTGLSAVSIAFYRLAVAASVLLVVAARRVYELGRALRKAPLLLVVTGIGLAVYQTLYSVAVTDVGVSVATMICIGLAPVLITLGEALGGHRWPTLTAATTVTVATGGLALVTLGAAGTKATSPHPLMHVGGAFTFPGHSYGPGVSQWGCRLRSRGPQARRRGHGDLRRAGRRPQLRFDTHRGPHRRPELATLFEFKDPSGQFERGFRLTG